MKLKISAGQYSDKGRKESNQDFHGLYVPNEPQLSSKGIAIALADGISSSQVSQVAAQSAVTGFLEDYYCTSEAWSVRTSAERVLVATNSWLHSQTQQSQHRYDKDRGYVCTFSGMIIKSTTAHLFHVGDTRIYQLRDQRTHATDRGSPGLDILDAKPSRPRFGHRPQARHRLPVRSGRKGRRFPAGHRWRL